MVNQGQKHHEISAMIDSGSAITTISPNVVQALGLRTVPAEGNYTIRNADGTVNKGGWTKNVRAVVDTGVTRGLMDVAVVDTHDDKFLLGNDWLEKHQPTIDWNNGTIVKGEREVSFNGTAHLRTMELTVAPRRLRRHRRWKKIPKRIPVQDSDRKSVV